LGFHSAAGIIVLNESLELCEFATPELLVAAQPTSIKALKWQRKSMEIALTSQRFPNLVHFVLRCAETTTAKSLKIMHVAASKASQFIIHWIAKAYTIDDVYGKSVSFRLSNFCSCDIEQILN